MYEGMKDRAVDLGKTASSSDIIFDALRDEIISGNLKAGESIRQEYIAKIFNVSRIPVREALKRLEAQGLVENVRYKGCVVTSLSLADMEEIYELRAILEPMIIERAVANMTDETLAIAQKHCDAFSGEVDPAKWGEWNRLFHETLYRDSQRPYHLKVVGEAIDRIDPYLRAQLSLTDGMGRAREEHLDILACCARKDAKAAADKTRAHILGSYKVLKNYMNNQNNS